VMIFGMAAGLRFQCRFSFSMRQFPTLPCFSEASAAHRYRTHRLLFSCSAREIDVPLQPPVHNPASAVQGSLLDAGPIPMDILSLPTNSSDPPLSSAYNRELPAIIPHSGRWNAETNGLPSSLPEAGPSRVPIGSLASVPSSRVTGVNGVLHSRMNHSSFHDQDLQFGYDCDIGTGRADDRQEAFLAKPCLSVADHGRNPDNCSPAPGFQPATESICVDGRTALYGQSSTVYTHAGQSPPAVILSSESHRAGSQLPFFPPSPTWNSPKMHTPQMDSYFSSSQIYPQSSALAPANITLPPCEFVLTSNPADIASGCGPLLHGSQGLHHVQFPHPPPEVAALLTAQSSDDIVSPVFSRNSPLVRWTLPSEIGHFWSGFFKIYEVKVTHARHTVRYLISLCCGYVCSAGRNESPTKRLGYTYSAAYLAIFSGMGAWRRRSTPRR
jgi:hypothetical protein